MKKALHVATIINTLTAFEIQDMCLLQSLGYKVECAASTEEKFASEAEKSLKDLGIGVNNIPFVRSAVSKRHIAAFGALRKQFKCNYDIIHTHTPIASALTRLAAVKYRKHGTKVIYTAHGFHFFYGAPIKNWLLYFPVEWICSWFTDVIITINQQDYKRAKRYLHSKSVKYIHGVGIDISRYSRSSGFDVMTKRKEIGIPHDAIILISVGELNKDKNHQVVIKALKKLKNPNIHYCIAGIGSAQNQLIKLAELLNVQGNVHLLGFRSDIPELLWSADYFVFPSIFEGLPVSVMEAMAAGLPIVCSSCRGNTDLIRDKHYLFKYDSIDECVKAIQYAISHNNMEYTKRNMKRLIPFQKENVSREMGKIYKEIDKGIGK